MPLRKARGGEETARPMASRNQGSSLRGAAPALICSRPKRMRPMPIRTLATVRQVRFRTTPMTMPAPPTRKATAG